MALARSQRAGTHLPTAAAVVGLSLLPSLLLAPLFEAPFERDQGTYATIAQGWMHGSIPYRDLWDNKGPVLFLWYVASFASLGETIVAPRIMAAVAAGLSTPFIWAAAARLFGRRVGLMAAALFSLSFANVYLQVTANSEVFMLLPLSAGLWAFARGATGGKAVWFLAAGILTGLAVLTRQSAITAVAGYLWWIAAIWWRSPSERPRQMLATALLFAGTILAAAPFIAYFALHGSLNEFWYAMFGFNIQWSADQPFYLKLLPPLLANPAPLVGGLIFWFLAAIGIWRLWLRGDRTAWLVISWLASAEIAAQAVGHSSPHHSIQLLPGAALASSVGILYVVERWRQRDRRLASWAAAACVVTVVAAGVAYTRPTPADRFELQYTFRDYADDALRAPAVARQVRGMTSPGECVYEWGRSSQVFFLAGRQPCSRWMHNRPIEVDPSILNEVITDLKDRSPRLVIDTSEQVDIPPELAAYLANHYLPAGQVEYARFYVRADPSLAATPAAPRSAGAACCPK